MGILAKQVEAQDLSLFAVACTVELDADAAVVADFAPPDVKDQGTTPDLDGLSALPERLGDLVNLVKLLLVLAGLPVPKTPRSHNC